MKKVENVNLNTRAYQIDEDGYHALKKYLDQAAHQLANDPDKDEIIADFEQAIAEKCDQVLSDSKTVVTEAEIKNIITAMGPVNLDDAEASSGSAPAPASPKRFFLIKEGGMIGGVCNGLATYFNIDVTVVRLAAVLLTLFTSGAFILAYFVIMLVAPTAVTPEEKAIARGQRFNSKELLETARQKYAVLSDKDRWKQVADGTQPMLSRLGLFIRRLLRAISGLIALGGLMSLLGIVVAGIAGIWSLIISGQVFGVTVASSISHSLLAIFLASGLLVGAIPIFLVTLAAFRYAKSSTLKQNIWVIVLALCAFAVALGVSLAIVSANPAIRDANNYTDSQGHRLFVCDGENHCRHEAEPPKVVMPATVPQPANADPIQAPVIQIQPPVKT